MMYPTTSKYNSTILKTYIKDLQNVQSIINNISNVEVWANGSTGLLNANSLNSLKTAISGLSKEQALLVLSTKNLSQAQTDQVLSAAGLLNVEHQLTTAQMSERLTKELNSKADAEALLINSGLITQKELEENVTIKVTAAKIKEAVANGTLSASDAAVIAGAFNITLGNMSATISFDLLTKSIWANIKALGAWLVTNPVGWLILAAGAIFGVVKAVDSLTVSFDEAIEKTKSSKQELDQLTSDISDLNKELETTKDRIDELLEKANSGTISLLEEEELNKLKEQNDELQREIALKEKLAEIDAKEAAENAAYSLTYKTDDDKWDQEYNATDRIDKLQRYVDSANYYQEKLSEINQQILDIEESATDNSYKNDSTYKKLIKQQEEYQKGLQKVEKNISTTYKELSDEDDGLYYNGKVVDGYEYLVERLDTVYLAVDLYLNGKNEDTTEKYVEAIKNKLIESGLSKDISNAVAEGFSVEELNSVMDSEIIDWSQCLGLDDATAVIENIKEQLASVGNANENPISSFEDAWASSFTSEKDAVKELGNNLLELAEQGHLTIETFKEADSTDYFKNLGISADEAVSKINKLVDESKQLSSMSDQISSMADALGTKQENGFVSADTLSGFNVEVRGLDSWDRFQEVLGSTVSSYEECQEAANALATEWVNSSDFLAQLTDQNEEYYKTQLEAMGVENYEEVIEYAQALNEAKEALSQASIDVTTATTEEIQAFIDEGTYSELAQQQIWALYAAKLAEQAAAIDSSSDCQQFMNLANDAMLTAEAIKLLNDLMNIYNGLESGVYNGNRLLREEALAEATRIKSELESLANGENQGLVIEPTVKLGNKGKSSAKSAGKEAGDAYVDAFKEELNELQDLRDRGVIDESEYLRRLRELYTRYFADRKEYLDEFRKYERQYLEGKYTCPLLQ